MGTGFKPQARTCSTPHITSGELYREVEQMAEKKVYQQREDRNPANLQEGWVWFGLADDAEEILRLVNQQNRSMEERQGLTPGGNDYVVYPSEAEEGRQLIVLGPQPSGRGPSLYFREATNQDG